MVSIYSQEAMCNMMFEPQVFDSYASATTLGKIKIFIALCDAEDFATRRAASGVIAILSSHPNICKLVQDDERGMQILVGLCSEPGELCHRGIECLKNMACCGGLVAQNVVSAGGKTVFEKMLGSGVQEIANIAAEGLAALRG